MPVMRTIERPRRIRRQTARPATWRVVMGVLGSLVCLACVGALAFAFYGYLQTAPHYRVQQVDIDGNDRVSDAAIRAVAGLDDAPPLLFLDLDAVAARVSRMPLIEACRVERALPDRVRVIVQERQPVATLLVHNRLFELDREGVVLAELDAAAPHVGPLITGAAGLGVLEPGDALRHRAVREALALWTAYRDTPLGQETTVSEIVARAPNDLRMYCNELPFEMRWGRIDYALQAQRLNHLWAQRRADLESCADYVDLRFEDQLACR